MFEHCVCTRAAAAGVLLLMGAEQQIQIHNFKTLNLHFQIVIESVINY